MYITHLTTQQGIVQIYSIYNNLYMMSSINLITHETNVPLFFNKYDSIGHEELFKHFGKYGASS